ncbi:MAG: sulfite exporter TauE/SafE family protein [Acidobacteriota bacterium]
MDALLVDFQVSGVRTLIFLPPLVAFVVSFFSSMGGVSGAFFLLPYQVSILQFTSPSVTSTNFVYNIVAIPSGVLRYLREGRMAWPLAGVILAGTLPGVFLGYSLRVSWLPDPGSFKLFAGCVLLYIAGNLVFTIFRDDRRSGSGGGTAKSINAVSGIPNGSQSRTSIRSMSLSLKKIEYTYGDEAFSVNTLALFLIALAVGVVGGAYGIGGGSLLAPLCVAVFHLPVYTVAGACLLGTFLTSIAGVLFYSLLPLQPGLSTSPDWMLGILFGLGGILGMYCGARLQKHVPQKYIKGILALIMLFLSCRYISGFFST